MKIRIGFVSNSSSSSFVAWGVSKEDIVFSDEYYLQIFINELAQLDEMKVSKNDYFERWYAKNYAKMISLQTKENKIEYSKKNLVNELSNDNFEQGGQENDFVGLTVEWFEKNHSELTFGQVREFVAQELNKSFGTKFVTKDIGYREEGWYNG